MLLWKDVPSLNESLNPSLPVGDQTRGHFMLESQRLYQLPLGPRLQPLRLGPHPQKEALALGKRQ